MKNEYDNDAMLTREYQRESRQREYIRRDARTMVLATIDELKSIGDSMRTMPFEHALSSDLNSDYILDNRDALLIQRYIGEGLMDDILEALNTMPDSGIVVGDNVLFALH